MKKSCLILEGGATRGVFTAGALDYLMEQKLYLPHVIGVSAGSCNAIDYASMQPGRTKDCMIPRRKEDQYLGLRSMLRTKTLFDMDLIFETYPKETYPFDFETYRTSPVSCEMTVTNCLTGKAEYLDNREELEAVLKICRASCSMPVVSRMVEINGVPYLDGGVADSVPVAHALREGYKKCVVILTRNAGYRKKRSRKAVGIYRTVYEKYPELVKALYLRPVVYNHTMELIERLEAEGHLFVLRPEMPVVSRTEQDTEALTAFYDHGYEQMKRHYETLCRYLE